MWWSSVTGCSQIEDKRGQIWYPIQDDLFFTTSWLTMMRVCACVCPSAQRHTQQHLTFLLLLSKPDSLHTSSIMCELKQSVDVLFCGPLTPTRRFKTDSLTKVTLFPRVIKLTYWCIVYCLLETVHLKLYKCVWKYKSYEAQTQYSRWSSNCPLCWHLFCRLIHYSYSRSSFRQVIRLLLSLTDVEY